MEATARIVCVLTAILTGIEGGYILTAPQVMLGGSVERICLSLEGVDHDLILHLMLVDRVSVAVEQHYMFAKGQDQGCVELSVPLALHGDDRHVTLWATGISQSYNFSSSAPVIVRNDPTVTFIQTDKPLYNPGHSVKIRILTVDVNLKPILTPVSEMAIVDPHGVRVRQWRDVRGEDGLVSREMELSEEPVLGQWTIEAEINNRRQKQTFKVQEYVLPKFEVIVKPPPFLLANSPSITAEICAQYTYGKEVKGVMEVEVCIKSPPLSSIPLLNEPPCDKVTEKIDGCRMFSLDSKLVNLGSADFPFWDHRVYINASVTETATGVTQYGFSNSAKLMQEALKLDFSKSSKYFKPGMPYKGKVRVKHPDGRPARNEPIKVAAVDYESGVRAEDVFVSNENGEVYFVLPGELLLASKEVTLLAEAIRYKDSANLDNEDRHIMYQPTALIKIRAWYSRSKSFIQIFPVEEAVQCGKELSVGVAYTTTPGSYLKFHYQVVARGNIVKTGHKLNHFNLHVFDTENKEGVLKVQKQTGYSDPPSWLDKDPLSPDYFFNQAFPDLAEPPTGPDSGNAKPVPVEEEEIVPKHYEPLAGQPDPEDNPFAGREPVSEDFIQPEHFEPLSKIPLPDFSADPVPGRQPVREDFIQPDHYEPLGEQVSAGHATNPYAGRQPVNEEFIEPKYYQPLGTDKKARKRRESEPIKPEDYPLYPDPIKEGDRVVIDQDDTTFEESTHISHLQLEIPITPEMAPEAQLLVYYVRPLDGETVADAISIKVKRCFENEVDFKFKKPKVRPGKKTTVRVKAEPGSLCGISVVDKSVFLAGGNTLITPEKVFRQLAKYEIGRHFGGRDGDNDYCQSKTVNVPGDLEFPSLSDIIGPPGSNFPPLPEFTPPTPEIGQGPPALGPLRKRRSPFNQRRRLKKLRGSLRNLNRRGSAPGRRRTNNPPFYQEPVFYSPYVDSIKAFRSAGLVTLTDLALETRPCEVRDIEGPGLMPFDEAVRGVPGPGSHILDAAIDDNTLDVDRDIVIGEGGDTEDLIRSYFPETWLWDLMRIGDTGMGLLTRSIPDTITEWVGGVMCTNPKAGLGVSNQASVTTFQPFFISYTLPYSAVRGERLPVLVTIFNYLKSCLEIKLSLKKSRRFELVAGESPPNFCVCEGAPTTHRFFIIPKALGKIRIAVDSRSVSLSGACPSNNSTVSSKVVKARDRVVKKLLVEAEGIPEEYTYSSLVCPRDQPGGVFEDDIKLKLPPNVVPGSARAYFTVTGDLMGPAINGLEKLIELPTGCGEQNMLNFAPNIYILQYLEGTEQLTPPVELRAKNFMNKGYQRELTYRHQDGSYSAFGASDETGSMWLTAFVVKSLAQAQPYLYIDREDLEKSTDWFQMRQLDSGCFPPVGQVLHKEMKGGLNDAIQGQAALTAYVLIAMLEANISREHQSVQQAVRCIEAANFTDSYTVALAAYAITLYDVNSGLRAKLMNKLHEKGKFENGLLHWERETTPLVQSDSEWQKPYTQAASTEVEMTAYALLAYISSNQPNSIMLARPIVQWLTKQRNSRGGFSSTQDTVIALQALAQFSTMVYSDGKNIQFRTEGTRFRRRFNVTDEDKLVLKSAKIRRVPNMIKVTAEGIGCGLIQTSLRYNVASQPLTGPPFEIKVGVFRSKSDINDCKKRTINICTRYTGSISNMVIVKVKMVTGWVPIKETIVPVTMADRLGIKRFEINNNFVNFYFEELTSQRRCFEFEVYQEIKLTAPKDAMVTVFDYYETDQTVTAMYNIKTICGTKAEIPFEITDEVGPMTPMRVPDSHPFEEQMRVSGFPGPSAGMEDPFLISQRRVEPALPPFLIEKLKAAKEKEKQAQKNCPVCVSERPEDFPQRYCSAHHVYKIITGRKGNYPLKLLSDFRPQKGKVPINGFSEISLNPACKCELIYQKGQVMVLAHGEAYSKKLLTLNSAVTVVPVSKQIEREARVLSSASCHL